MKHKIVVGMRTKNEDWIIDKTLQSLSNFCHTVVIYDDQSTDDTEEICRSYKFVDWKSGSPRNPHLWEAGQQATDVFNFVKPHNPDYIFILDADEIPTPSVIDFFDSLDEEVNLWKIRMINLFKDDKHYRTDQYVSKSGSNINWNPFSKNAWSKHALIKYDKNFSYSYEPLRIGLGSFGPFHPAPNNTPIPHGLVENFYIVHYGKISPDFVSGKKQKFYAKNDEASGIGNYESRLKHHMDGSGLYADEPCTLIPCQEEWFWKTK
jgi:glycosyltransferase involved in cell wall biosynthesis